VGRLALGLLSAGGIAVATGSLAGVIVSESTGLFGFMETGYWSAIVVSISLEVATIVLLLAYLVLRIPATGAYQLSSACCCALGQQARDGTGHGGTGARGAA
jgi:hypothetical protein